MKNILIIIFMIIVYQMIAGADASETRGKIIVIDSGISKSQINKPYICKGGVMTAFDNDSGIDFHGHGTNIINIISSKINQKKYCIVSIKVYQVKAQNMNAYIKGLRMASFLYPKIVNISMTGDQSSYLETAYITNILSTGSKVIVAAGNEGFDLNKVCNSYPACIKNNLPKHLSGNFLVVSNKDVKSANYGRIVTHYRKGFKQGFPVMSGTSQSTANLTAELVK